MRISKTERRKLEEDPYFIFKSIDESCVRLVSSSTLDSWIIDMKDTYCILYHDHPGQKRYHEHRRFKSVDEAVSEIKNHDMYMMKNRRGITKDI